MQSPRVAHVIDTGGPGGAETLFARCACNDFGGRVASCAVVPYEGWLSKYVRTLGGEPQLLKSKGSVSLRYFFGLKAIIEAHRATHIHAHLLGANVYSALGIPVIAVFHGATDLAGKGGRLLWLKRALLRLRHVRVVAVSRGVQHDLIAWGLPAERIRVIYNGIDTERFSPGRNHRLRESLGVADDEVLIGAVGNIRAPKAYDVLIRAIALLPPARRVRVAVFGQGSPEQLAPLAALAQTLKNHNSVSFQGFSDAGPDLYRAFDLFVSSAASEGLPLSFLEAMATGIPVVATPTTGALELISSGETGLLATDFGPEALATALERALGDVGFRERARDAGRALVVREFSSDAMNARYLALYTEST